MGITGKALNNTNLDHLRRPTVEHVADCEDCGAKSVLNRRVVHSWIQNPYSHWRSKCNCGCFQNPITGEWEKTNAHNLTKDMRLMRQK
jgi:hypothetical protein